METLQEIFERNKDHYRGIVADMDGFSAYEKDEAITIIFNTLHSIIEQVWGVHPVQLALYDKFKNASQNMPKYDSLTCLAKAEPVDLKIEGVQISQPQSIPNEDIKP